MKARHSFRFAFAGVAVMGLAMALGPLFSPSWFSWIRYTTSEQAAQHLQGAWIMRTGFVCYGLGVVLAAISGWKTRQLVNAALALFGLGLVAAAIWSNAPIHPDQPADVMEDRLHSIASAVVGTAFALACISSTFKAGTRRADPLALTGLVIAVAIPLGMEAVPELRGALQRAMFLFSFVFILREFRVSGRLA